MPYFPNMPTLCRHAFMLCGYSIIFCRHALTLCGYAIVFCRHVVTLCGHVIKFWGHNILVCVYGISNEKYFYLLQKKLLYYRKLYFTTDNFTSWKGVFLQNLNQLIFFNLLVPQWRCISSFVFYIVAFEIWHSLYFDINWYAKVWIKHTRDIFKWFKNDSIED